MQDFFVFFILGKFNLKSNWTLAPEATENWKIMAQLKAERIVEIFISHISGKPLKFFEKSAHVMNPVTSHVLTLIR